MLVVGYFASDWAPPDREPAFIPPEAPVPPVPVPPVVPRMPQAPAARAPLRPKAIFNSRKGGLLCVAISKDEKTLAAGLEDGSIIAWDVASSKPTTLTGHKFPVRSLAFLPHGKMLLSGAGELPKPQASGEVKLWGLDTGKEEANYAVPDIGSVWAVAVSPDGRMIVAGGDLGIKSWEVTTGTGTKRVERVKGVRAMAVAPNGRYLAVTADQPEVNFYGLPGWDSFSRPTGHARLIEATCIHPDGQTMAIGGQDGTVKLWDLQWKATGDFKPRSVRVSETSAVRSLAYWRSGGGWRLAVGLSDQTVKLIDASNPGKPTDFPAPGEEAGGFLAASPEGPCLVTAHRNGVIRLWGPEAGRRVRP
jgi:WD40 repeat protein